MVWDDSRESAADAGGGEYDDRSSGGNRGFGGAGDTGGVGGLSVSVSDVWIAHDADRRAAGDSGSDYGGEFAVVFCCDEWMGESSARRELFGAGVYDGDHWACDVLF